MSSSTQAYLPLAHIMELAVEVTCFAVGCRVGYGSPGTITPTALKMLQTTPPQLGDAGLLGPTLFVAAPAVLDKVLIAIKANPNPNPNPNPNLYDRRRLARGGTRAARARGAGAAGALAAR